MKTNQTALLTLLTYLILNVGNLYSQCPPASESGVHVVQKDETLYSIAKRYKVTVEQVRTWNGMSAKDVLQECTELRVKSGGGTASTTKPNTKPNPSTYSYSPSAVVREVEFSGFSKQAGSTHIVRAGETVGGIAEMYGFTERRFREFNGLSATDDIRPNQLLRSNDCNCPSNSPTNPTPYSTEPSGTQSGDTNFQSAENYLQQPSVQTVNPAPESTANAPTSNAVGGKFEKAKAGYMNTEELAMVDEINLIRSNPSGYIPYVEEYIRDMQQNGEFGNSIATARELIEELRNTPVRSILTASECVYSAARKHGDDQRKQGDTNHKGSDGSYSWDRILRECSGYTDGGENLVGGPSKVRKSVMLLLVDDGISTRGHRKTLLQPEWKYVACYKIGTVGDMPNCWIQNFGY
jgi:LysM repeat protein